MSRLALAGTATAVFACMLSGCGASHKQRAARTRTVPSVARPASSDEVLSLAGLGTFEGRCPRGAHRWTLRFVVTAEAGDTLSYRVGTGARRTVNVAPGGAIAIQLAPGTAKTHEPPDRFVPPIGQARGVLTAMSVPTTAPLQAVIYQATEPQTLQADVNLALSTIGGESGQCVLVGSRVNAYTYLNG